MRSLAHIIILKKREHRARRRAVQREQAWRAFEQCAMMLSFVMLCLLVYHFGGFMERRPVAAEKLQFEHWAGQKMTELVDREKKLERRERRAI